MAHVAQNGIVGLAYVAQKGIVNLAHVAQNGMVSITNVAENGIVSVAHVAQNGMVSITHIAGNGKVSIIHVPGKGAKPAIILFCLAPIFEEKILFSFIMDCVYRLIGLIGRMFTNGPGDLGSIPGRVIPKTLKMVLDTALLNTQQYKVCIKGKVEQTRETSSAPPTSQCSSYWKGSLLVALDYSRQLYLLYLRKAGQNIVEIMKTI